MGLVHRDFKRCVGALLVALFGGCDYLFNLPHVDSVADGIVGPHDDGGTDAPPEPSFCAMQPQWKMCADFESTARGLASNFAPMNMGTGVSPVVAAGGLSAPDLLRFTVGANNSAGPDSSIARAKYTETVGTNCPLGDMMTVASLDPSAWHEVDIYINVGIGSVVVAVDGETHSFDCQPGFAGTPGLMQTDLGARATAPHSACGVAFDDVMIR